MSVTINARGTNVPTFTVGTNGMVLSLAGGITPPSGNDLILTIDSTKSLVITSGTSDPGTISTAASIDLQLTAGGSLFLMGAKWPSSFGTDGQVLTTDSLGNLNWGTIPNPGIISTATTLALLPAANTVPIGTRATITDADTPTFMSPAAGSGAIVAPVYSDGTQWVIG